MRLVRLACVLAIPVCAWSQFGSSEPDLERISGARNLYANGRSFEEQGNYGYALEAYRSAEAVLSRKQKRIGDLPDVLNGTSLERRYASAAVLASSIALDEARVLGFLGRAKDKEFTLALAGAGSNAIAVLSDEDLKASGSCASPLWSDNAFRVDRVFFWTQAPVVGQKMLAYLDLGRMQLMWNELFPAKECFERALTIDGSNLEALQNVSAITNILDARKARKDVASCERCLTKDQKALINAGITIGAALLTSRYPRGAPIAGAILMYFNSHVPEKPQ
jgi:tetratricopeptide (TPR) repeat protein